MARQDHQYAITNLLSILAADSVVWNSQYNCDSFIEGINEISRHSPSDVPKDWRAWIEAKSVVIWPPVYEPRETMVREPSSPLGRRVVWPHRWEHDKGPEELLEFAERWTERLGLSWVLLGESFDRVPKSIASFKERFANSIDHMGHVEDRAQYFKILETCDWVLSTAKHEFFGMAVTEALFAGCLPWLPNRLSYPELLGEDLGYSPAHPPTNPDSVRKRIIERLEPARAKNATGRLDDHIALVANTV